MSLQQILSINSENIFQDENNQIVKEITSRSQTIFSINSDLIKIQEELANKHPNYILRIKRKQELDGQKIIRVIYDCDTTAQSLQKVKCDTSRQKFELFKKLLEISQFLKQNGIQHKNLKPSNLILYNEKLYLTDFGDYKQSYTDVVNFISQKDASQKRNLYPYLSPELIDLLCKNQTSDQLHSAINNRSKDSVKMQDQYAIGVMMLEIFSPFEDESMLIDIDYCKSLLQKREEQINNINLYFDFPKEGKEFIKQTITSILENQILIDSELKTNIDMIDKQIVDYKINKKALMNQKNQALADHYLERAIGQFDLNLLYFFTEENRMHLFLQQEIQPTEFQSQLKEKIKKLQQLTNNVTKLLNYRQKGLESMKIQDLFFTLVELDRKIEILIQKQNWIELETHFNIKRNLKKFYDQINNTQFDQFEFNNDIIIVDQQQPQQQFLQQHQEVVYEDISPLVQIYNFQNASNQQDCLLDQAINSNFKSKNLRQYFTIYKLLKLNNQNILNKRIYKDINNVDFIYFGIMKDKSFKGEIIHTSDQEKNIVHYLNIEKNFNQGTISSIQGKTSQMLYLHHLHLKNPEKFMKQIEYKGQILNGEYNGEGEERNYKDNVLYRGTWKNNKLNGMGTKQIINTDNLKQGDPYKWEGNFTNHQLNGQQIKTYLLFYNNKMMYFQVDFNMGKKEGLCLYYQRKANGEFEQIKRTYFKSLLCFKEIEVSFQFQ